MTILSLDISSKFTGYAVYKNRKYIKSGILDRYSNNQKSHAGDRFEGMVDAIKGLLGIINPDLVVIEKPFICGIDIDSCETQFMIYGAVVYFCKKRHYNVIAMSPREWRDKLSFHHSKQKKNRDDKRKNKQHSDDYKKLAIEFANSSVEKEITDDNEAEAICIALAYIGE